MRRRLIAAVALAALAALLPGAPNAVSAEECASSPVDPNARLPRYLPHEAGAEVEYCIFYGPYVIPGGQDLSRVDFDVALGSGFVVAGGPTLSLADGTEPSHQTVHIHHSHWWFIDPNDRDRYPLPWMRWISGAGEEVTRADFRDIAAADPTGPRYGLHVREHDRVAMINMIHNKTTTPLVVWIKVDLAFVHGTAEEIKDATGKDYHDLTGTLVGGSFNVNKGSGVAGKLTFPRDLAAVSCDGIPTTAPNGSDVAGCGRVWTAPFDGTMVIGAGHLHPGGEKVFVKNLGQAADPCPSDGRYGLPGTTLYELDLINRVQGARFTEDFQIEITQPGFRAPVRQGDRIVLNGVYDTVDHAWWEAMSFTGFYIDELDYPAPGEECTVRLADDPAGDATIGIPNRDWHGVPDVLCGGGLGGPCDRNLPPPGPGPSAGRVTIAGFQYLPGDLNSSVTWTPQVPRGQPVEFVNADIAHYVRHTVTSCALPCDGRYVANYPLPDGTFDSRYLGWEPTSGGRPDITQGEIEPRYTLATAPLEPGRYTYFCRVHPWMRGTFEITP